MFHWMCVSSRGWGAGAGAQPVWVWWTWDHLANCHNVSKCRLQRNQVNKTGDKCPDTTQPRAASSCQHLRDQQNTGDTEVKRRRLFIKAFLYNSNWYLLPRDWGGGSAALGQVIVRAETDTLRLENSFNEERIMINIPLANVTQQFLLTPVISIQHYEALKPFIGVYSCTVLTLTSEVCAGKNTR